MKYDFSQLLIDPNTDAPVIPVLARYKISAGSGRN